MSRLNAEFLLSPGESATATEWPLTAETILPFMETCFTAFAPVFEIMRGNNTSKTESIPSHLPVRLPDKISAANELERAYQALKGRVANRIAATEVAEFGPTICMDTKAALLLVSEELTKDVQIYFRILRSQHLYVPSIYSLQ